MKISDTYDAWAESYDSMDNKTRDLEAEVLRSLFRNPHYGNILELGCGTGKNTGWLSQKADFVTALDFSAEMILRAEVKTDAKNVTFIHSDLNREWPIKPGWANLITCSLVMEHIEDLHSVFAQGAKALKSKGRFYVCELHPYRQYSGSRAHFKTGEELYEPKAYIHHLSDYLQASSASGFKLLELNEHFDDKTKENLPRLISLVFENA